jgi:hypothetical protein
VGDVSQSSPIKFHLHQTKTILKYNFAICNKVVALPRSQPSIGEKGSAPDRRQESGRGEIWQHQREKKSLKDFEEGARVSGWREREREREREGIVIDFGLPPCSSILSNDWFVGERSLKNRSLSSGKPIKSIPHQ